MAKDGILELIVECGRSEQMKTWLVGLLCCLLLGCCVTAAHGEDAGRRYLFELSANGQEVCMAQPGDVVTVTFRLCRRDADESAPVYGVQNEICYDGTFFEMVEGSLLCGQGIRATCVSEPDGGQRVYMNFVAFDGGEVWPAERLVGTFQLRVVAREGAAAITCGNYLVSTADGRDNYTAAAQDVTVALSEEALQALDAGSERGGRAYLWWLLFVPVAVAAVVLRKRGRSQ